MRVEVPPRDRGVLASWVRSTSFRAGLAQRARNAGPLAAQAPEAARQDLSARYPGGHVQRRIVRSPGVELAASREDISMYLDFLVAAVRSYGPLPSRVRQSRLTYSSRTWYRALGSKGGCADNGGRWELRGYFRRDVVCLAFSHVRRGLMLLRSADPAGVKEYPCGTESNPTGWLDGCDRTARTCGRNGWANRT